jgi:hypothetical protein
MPPFLYYLKIGKCLDNIITNHLKSVDKVSMYVGIIDELVGQAFLKNNKPF